MGDYVGQKLGNYRLVKLLGRGGFADVYLGEHVHLNTQAAIKVLRTQLAEDHIDPFRQEARTIAHLEHPHIIRVLDFGVEGMIPFLVMDYAPNGTLRQHHPRHTTVPPQLVVSYVKQVASALQYAHERHLVHRDIKPENMLLSRNNEVLLSDFGIALVTESTRAALSSGGGQAQGASDLAGTVLYMAPEQIQGRAVPASDQYALAVVAYEWLCGAAPFRGNYMEIMLQHMTAAPPPLREKMPSVSPEVEQVVMTALAKDPQQRFRSVQAFAKALEQAFSPGSTDEPAMSGPVLYGPAGRIRLGTGVVTLGRKADNRLVISDPKASSHHAEIRPDGQGYAVLDLGSTNGTFLNEQRIEAHQLHSLKRGDAIRIGDTKLIYDVLDAPEMQRSLDGPTKRAETEYINAANAPFIGNTGYGKAAPYEVQPQPSFYVPQQAPAQPAPGGYISYDAPNAGGRVSGVMPRMQPPGIPPVAPASMPPQGVTPPPASQQGQSTVYPLPGQAGAGKSTGRFLLANRRNLLILLCAALVLLIIGSFVIYSNVVNGPTPAKTLDTFCSAIQAGNNQVAYTTLSTGFQNTLSLPEFSGFFAKVSSCSHGAPALTGNSTTASLTIVAQAARTDNDQATLVQENGDWKIDSIANVAALHTTLNTFCNGLIHNNFQDAWKQLSSNLQNKLSTTAATSVRLLTSFFPNVTTCAASPGSISGDSASASLSIVDSNTTENDTLTLLKDAKNGWKIDTFSNLSTPGKTLNAFCNGLKSQDYQTAYAQLSSDIQARFSESAFANAYSNNNGHGRVTSCSISNVKQNGTSATGTLSYTLLDRASGNANYTLINQNDIWKINSQN
ncbi:MAG TPA: protein kinase [Ktedonobacteraceae bacterium]|jgi:serine/threonine protein kinase/limonene-1,2-epoxide hydrolase|nr:protein kinase [Ktedonobacteraceae bacterium]